MAVFLLLPALALLGVILLAPLMLPGAVVALLAVSGVLLFRRHHPRGLHLH